MPDTVYLVTAPVSTDFEDPQDVASRAVCDAARNPKLGVLALAAVLERHGVQPWIFDLDKAYAEFLAQHEGGLEAFPERVAGRIAGSGSRLFGFSTICSSYPLTLRIAEAVKTACPGCTILLGGPQASVVDRATLTAFPFIDFILRGEADLTLPLFFDAWCGKTAFASVPGLTFRSPFGIQRNPDPPVVDNLDDLPLPAFHLTGNLEGAEWAGLELGRGCPFACTFCSTNDFFRRKFRVRSPQRVLDDMRAIAARYGIRKFNLVHDMFTVDRRRVVAFCEAMIDSGDGFSWACSARTDCVDEELLELMARAGCEGMFFGVETGSQRLQALIDKDLDLVQSKKVITAADRFGIHSDVSLITGFPEENEDDLRGTLDMFVHSLRHPKSEPQLHLLAPLSGTPIEARYQDQLVLEELCSDASYQGRLQNSADRKLIRAYPHIFPNFYLLPAPGLDRGTILELREFMLMGAGRLRWLLVALHLESDILDVFVAWRSHREILHPGLSGWDMRRYYMLEASRNEFVQHIGERLADSAGTPVEALVSYYKALKAASEKAVFHPESESVQGVFARNCIPVRARDVSVLELDWDIQEVIDALKKDEPLTPSRGRRTYRIEESCDGVSQLIEITPLVAAALELCDGSHTVKDFIGQMALRFEWAARLRRYAAECLLESLRDEGFIAIYGPGPSDGNRQSGNRERDRKHRPGESTGATAAISAIGC